MEVVNKRTSTDTPFKFNSDKREEFENGVESRVLTAYYTGIRSDEPGLLTPTGNGISSIFRTVEAQFALNNPLTLTYLRMLMLCT